ncbi:KWG Leptospira [Moraxella caprae]|uniref:KWG Leptospira n=1 Tax=Moraxella caprae TaxID=90240 RepID=A0A378R447_9GAMM|nr:WG repeat-containing protein [Moraxella caprae]STZ08660.1 KWG Leptospira [Moraxella caprae]
MSIQQITYRYAQGKQWALVDKNNRNITEYVYDGISYLTEKLFEVCKKDKYGIIDDNGKLITDTEYDWLEKINEHLFSVRVDKYWGLINNKGDILLSITYDQIYETPYRLEETSYIQIWKNGKCGLINGNGEIVVQADTYDLIDDEIQELGIFRVHIKRYRNESYIKTHEGYININNEIVIEPKYKYIYHAFDNYFIGCLGDNRVGMIDIYQNKILQFQYKSIEVSKDAGLILLQHQYGKKWELIKIKRNLFDKLRDFNYQSMEISNNSTIKIKDKDLYGLMDIEGNIILPIIYDYISSYDNVEPYFVIEKNGLRGLADECGNICIPVQYELLRKVSSNLVRVKRNGKYGICDLQGNEVVPCIHEYLYNAKDDRIAVCKNGKWGFFDNNGNAVIDFIYDEVESFSHQVASVVKDGQRYFLDIQGNFITQEYYGKIRFQSHR